MLKTIYTNETREEGFKCANVSDSIGNDYVWIKREYFDDEGKKHIEQIRLTKNDIQAIAEGITR